MPARPAVSRDPRHHWKELPLSHRNLSYAELVELDLDRPIPGQLSEAAARLVSMPA